MNTLKHVTGIQVQNLPIRYLGSWLWSMQNILPWWHHSTSSRSNCRLAREVLILLRTYNPDQTCPFFFTHSFASSFFSSEGCHTPFRVYLFQILFGGCWEQMMVETNIICFHGRPCASHSKKEVWPLDCEAYLTSKTKASTLLVIAPFRGTFGKIPAGQVLLQSFFCCC